MRVEPGWARAWEKYPRAELKPELFSYKNGNHHAWAHLKLFQILGRGLFTASLKFGPLLQAWTLVGSTSRQVDEERRVTVSSNNNNNNNNSSSNNNNHGRSKSRSQSRFFYLFAADCFFKGSHERSWLPDCELSKSFRCFERVQATPSPFCNWCWVRYLLINTNEQLELATRQQVILHLPHLGSCSSSWCLEFEP